MEKILKLLFLLSVFVVSIQKFSTTENKDKSFTENDNNSKMSEVISNYRNQRIIFIDYSKPSSEKRLWVLENGKILLNTYVSHGKNSGLLYATDFSNKPGSNKSCLGIFETAEVYKGKHGLSLKIKGLDSINNNAYERNIVFHSSNYVSEKFLSTHGYMGRSQGCFVTDYENNKKIIELVKEKSSIKVIVTN